MPVICSCCNLITPCTPLSYFDHDMQDVPMSATQVAHQKYARPPDNCLSNRARLTCTVWSHHQKVASLQRANDVCLVIALDQSTALLQVLHRIRKTSVQQETDVASPQISGYSLRGWASHMLATSICTPVRHCNAMGT